MTATVLQFPNQANRNDIHTAIRLYAESKISKRTMLTWIRSALEHEGVNSLKIFGYTVKLVPGIDSHSDPVIIIESKTVSPKKICPACGSKVAGFLAGDRVVTTMCLDCGCIYRFKERSEDL